MESTMTKKKEYEVRRMSDKAWSEMLPLERKQYNSLIGDESFAADGDEP
jgi:hypothetical protein